ncbi:hypothetical protein MMC09_001068 [Bachmanniomyces sp. S44760]|nr:hypothetical protein [Bachmanniomyces sp. S44760]
MSETHEILILGGNYAGVSVAHYLLRHTLTALDKANPSQKYHVTMVSPSTHFYHKIGAPRVLASPELIKFDQAFVPIADGFASYPKGSFTFVQGLAIATDAEKKMVTVSLGTDENGTTQALPYNSLVIATGTKAASPIWTMTGSHQESIQAMQDLHKALPSAKTILIAGGGPAGVESAGEIGTLYPSASTTILSGSTRLLSRLSARNSAAAERKLTELNVKTINNGLKVTSATPINGGPASELTFSDGSKSTVDIYIDATGGRPMTSFLPPTWLNEKGYVLTDPKTLRCTFPDSANIYAVGDVGSYSTGSVLDVILAVPAACSSIHIDLAGLHAPSEKTGANKASTAATKQRNYKAITDTQFVPIGPKGGVGQIFGWKIPSFFVWLLKSRDFMIGKAVGDARGERFLKA